MKKKAIIIGSGIAGIATSIRLQTMGIQSLVIEKNQYPGGKLTSFELNNFRFDAGPSLFTMPQFVEELFELSGKNTPDFFNYKKKEIICKYFWNDGTKLTAWAEKEKFIKECSSQFDIKENILTDYLKESKRKYDLTHSIFLEKSLHKFSSYLNIATIKALLKSLSLDLFTPLHQYNDQKIKEKHLVQFFDRFATYNGSSPFRTPGIMSMIPHLEQHYGTYIPKGGMVEITNSLVSLAKEIGVKFIFGENVEKINYQFRQAQGVTLTNGEKIKSNYVISNMDIVPTYRKLLPKLKSPEITLSQPRSSSALIFYWGITKEFPQLDLHNILFSTDYQKEFRGIFGNKNISDDPTIYINISSKDIEGDAPKGNENWFVMVNMPSNKGQKWDEIIKKSKENIIKKINTKLNCDIEKYISCEEILDPRTIEENTSSYQGALYGAASNNMLAAFLRHPNFSQKIKGLYFCGGSVHPGGGLPLCLLSAKIVAELIDRQG